MALKVLGYLSTETGKVYQSKSARKGAETKNEKKAFSTKLAKLQAKFNRA